MMRFIPDGARALLAATMLTGLCLAAAPLRAQQLVATINDSPITNFDLEQRAKLNRVLRLPTTREALLEAIFADRLKLGEAKKFKLQPGDQEVASMISRSAAKMKMQPQALVAAIQRGGVSNELIKEHFGAEYAWAIYTRSMNKGLDVSTGQVRAELAKKGSKGGAEYQIRQIVFIVSNAAAAANRQREAEGLRNRFSDCASGAALARALPDVAVKDPVTRSTANLPDELAAMLDRTPVGRLTPPQRTASGIEMVAVCGKTTGTESDAASESVRQELVNARYETEAEKLYRDVRKRAVVVTR
jgi:peptidyl-prolyl cis-trans isomerase SurA